MGAARDSPLLGVGSRGLGLPLGVCICTSDVSYFSQPPQAFTPGFGNSGFPPTDGGSFGAVAFPGTLAPGAQARDTFTPYGAGVYAPAPPQQYAAPFTAPAPAAQKGPISYAAVAVRVPPFLLGAPR